MTTPDVDLPPLPEADMCHEKARDDRDLVFSFSAEAMQAYALQAVLRERERCAQICDSVDNFANPMTARDCAAAIRGKK